MQRANRFWCIGLLLTVAVGIASCDRKVIYTHYEPAHISGWDKNDSLSFDIPTIKQSGFYRQDMGLRILNDFPFQTLSLVIKQTIHPSGYQYLDTVNCVVFDRQGRPKGSGISYYQYHFHFKTVRLLEGDSLHVSIMHNMKREIMPGISDVGLQMKLEKAI